MKGRGVVGLVVAFVALSGCGSGPGPWNEAEQRKAAVEEYARRGFTVTGADTDWWAEEVTVYVAFGDGCRARVSWSLDRLSMRAGVRGSESATEEVVASNPHVDRLRELPDFADLCFR